MAEPGVVEPPSHPSSAVASICATSDAGSGYVTAPSTAGREAAAGSAHWSAQRDGTANGDWIASSSSSGSSSSDSGRQGSGRQRAPSGLTEKRGSKGAEGEDGETPSGREKVHNGDGGASGAWQWGKNAGKSASGKPYRARRSASARPSPDPAEMAGETSPLIDKGNCTISDFIGGEKSPRKTPIDQRGKFSTIPTSDADQGASSDSSSSGEIAEVGRSEMLAWATATGGSTGDGARAGRPVRRKARHRRTASSGSSREPRLVATPSSAGSGGGSGGGGVSSRATPEDDVLTGDEDHRQALHAEGGDATYRGAPGARSVEPVLGKPATGISAPASGVAAAWSWRNLALAKTSTASTSATSINSAALGPSSSPQSELDATGSGGGGRGSTDTDPTVAVETATGGYSAPSSSSPSAPALAPAPASTLAAGTGGAATTAGNTARDSSENATEGVASGAGGKAVGPGKKVSSQSETGVNAAAPGAVHAVGTPSSRPPPVTASSTTRSRANGQRYPMDPPSPNSSACSPIASAAAGEGGGRTGSERTQQPKATPTASRTAVITDGSSNGSNGTLQVDVDGRSNSGGFNCLDSAGGGSFEFEAFDIRSTATKPTPRTNNGTTEEKSEDHVGSDSFDSGFGSVASPGETIGGMTEGEIVAAAEAAMNSAKKAAAGAAPETHTPPSRLPFGTAASPSASNASATVGGEDAGAEVGVGKSRQDGEQGDSGASTRRTIRDDSWWKDGAAKALAASAENKKTPARSRGGTPGRSRNAVGGAPNAAAKPTTAAGRTATSRGPKGTPSTRGGSRRGDRAGGGGGGLSVPEGGEGGGGGAASSLVEGYLSPALAASEAGVSPTFSTISSREQAERDSERLAAVAGDRGYRRSSWGVALPSSGKGNTYGDTNSAVTGTPVGYGTDEGYFKNGGARSNRRGSRASYHSLDSSGWGLTSDEGGDGETSHRRWRPSLSSSVRSGGGGGPGTASSGTGPTPLSSAYGSGASVDASVFSDDEGSSTSRSSISTGYESSANGEEHSSATDRAQEWSGRRQGDEPSPSPPGDDAPPRDGDEVLPGHDNFPPPSPAGSPQTPASTQHRATSLNKLERSALKKKAHYEKQANAAAGAAIAAAALAAAAGATAAAHKQSSNSFGDRSQGGSASSNGGRNITVGSGGREQRRGRMPSETRAILSRGDSLPAFDVFHPRSDAGRSGHVRHVSGGDSGGGTGKPVESLSAWPRAKAQATAVPNQLPLSRRFQSTVSEGARPRHASVEEAIAMAVAWTPSQLVRGSAGGASSGHYGQSQQAAKDKRGGSVGQQRGGGGGAAGDRVSGSGGRTRDSQYFFSSRGSSVRGMSPAGIVQDHQQRHRNPSPAEQLHANNNSTKHEGNKDDSGRSRDGGRAERRGSRRPLPTPPTSQDQQQRRRRAKRREEASSSGQEQGRVPLAIPPLPKVLFRPPRTPRQPNHHHHHHHQQQQQQQQRRRPSGTRNVIALGDAAGGGGRGGYFRSSPPSSAGGYWPSFAGTPTSTSFSPSSAVANPFIATRYTERSSQSTRSNSTSHRGSGPARSGGFESRVSPSSPDRGIRVRSLPHAVRAGNHAGYNGDPSEGRRGGARGRDGVDHHSAVTSSPPRGGGRNGGASSSHRRTNSARSSGRKTHGGRAAANDSGSVSDLGGDIGARNNTSSSNRAIFRTVSLRGRSLFSGGPGLAERRSVSMSSFGGRGDPMRADSDYDRSQSLRGGGRGVANRVCSALSVGWLFSRNGGKAKGKGKKKKKKKKRKNGGPRRGVLDLSGTSSRRSAYSGAGVVGVMVGADDGYTSSDDDDDSGDDVFEIGGPRDIAVGVGGSRQSGRSARGGGLVRANAERLDFLKGDGKTTASEGGMHETGGAVTTASVKDDGGRNRLSFTRSGLLGLDRSANSSMSSYSFVQHAPSRGGGSAAVSTGAVRTNTADPSPGTDGGGGRQTSDSADPSANVTMDGGDPVKTNGNASRAAAATKRPDGVQYVNFNGHGGRGGGVVALRGAGVAAVEIQGDKATAGMGFSSMAESRRRPEVDEEEAKRRMDALLLRSRVHTHLNPTGAPGAGMAAH